MKFVDDDEEDVAVCLK